MTKSLNEMKNYNFDDRYYADTLGIVYLNVDSKFHKMSKGDKLSYFINKYGYVEYVLVDSNKQKKHIQAHRIVASLFIPNPDKKYYVNHIDGNKQNNNVTNLEWCTATENETHSFQVLKKKVWNKGKSLPSGKEYKGKIRPVQCKTLDGIPIKIYFNPTEAEQDGFSLKQISAVCNNRQKTHKGYTWNYIET